MRQFEVCHTAVPCNITHEKVTLDDKGGSVSLNMLHTQFMTPSLSLFYFWDSTVLDHKWQMGSSKHLTPVHWWEKELFEVSPIRHQECTVTVVMPLGAIQIQNPQPIEPQSSISGRVLSHTHSLLLQSGVWVTVNIFIIKILFSFL